MTKADLQNMVAMGNPYDTLPYLKAAGADTEAMAARFYAQTAFEAMLIETGRKYSTEEYSEYDKEWTADTAKILKLIDLFF
jgi:hypothetical protein